MTVLITLTTAGTDSGPFNLYTELDGYVTPFETGVDKIDLEAGYTTALVPDYATIVRVKSTGDCVNYIDITLVSTTTTTTTTASVTCAEFELAGGLEGRTFNFTNCDGNPQSVTIPAGDSAPFCIRLPYFASGATNIGACGGLTTTTTTTMAGAGLVYISNFDTLGGTVLDVRVNGVSIIVTSGGFPAAAGENIIGYYGPAVPGLSTVEVNVSVATDAPINLGLNNGYTDCLIGTGTSYVEFINVDLSTNANITISLQPQGSSCL